MARKKTTPLLRRSLESQHGRFGWYAIILFAVAAASLSVAASRAIAPKLPQPTIDRVAPFLLGSSDVTYGGVRVRIFGSGFRDGAFVVFSHYPAIKTYVVSPTEISAVLSPDTLLPGWYDVLVRNADRQYAILHAGLGVRDENGKIPEKFYAIHGSVDALTFAAEGSIVKSGNAAPSYDNYPNISVGSYTTYNANQLSGYAQVFADRYDYLFGTFPMGAIHTMNTHMQQYPYADMTEYNNGLPQTGRDGHTDAKITSFVSSYNTSHDPDIQAEDFYLHAKCDCDMLYGTSGHCQTYSVSDPKCTQTAGCPYSFITGTKTQYYGWNAANAGKVRGVDVFTPNAGCLASTATSRTESRMMSAYLPQWDVPNYGFSQLPDYFANTFQNENISWAGGTSAVNGVNFDTVVKDNPFALADGMHMSWEYWGADVRSATTPAQPFYDYFTLQQSVRSKLSANAGQGGFRYSGNVITIPNEYPQSIYTPDTLTSVQDNMVEIFFDHYKNSANTYQGECGTWKSLIDETKNKSERFFLNSYERVGPYCSSGPTYDCRTSRGKIESLAMYYLLQNSLTSYLYAADVVPLTPDAFWNPSVTVDIGQPATMPSGAKDIFGNTGTDNFYNFDDRAGGFACPIVSSTPTNIVYARNYTNGLVLVKHRYDWSDSVIYGDESAADTTKKDYALGGYYHPVSADGTLGAATNSVNLSNSEGAVFLKNRAPVLALGQSQSVAENQTLTFDVTATDPDDDSISLGAVGLPSGSTYLANGENRATFTWTPSFTQAGVYIINFTGSDIALTGSQAVTITVNDSNRTPEFSPVSSQSVSEGDLLTFAIAVTDSDSDLVDFSASNVPSGASFTDHRDNTATFKWIPDYSQSGAYTVRLSAFDGQSTATLDVTITVGNNPNPPLPPTGEVAPVFASTSEHAGKEGDLLAVTVGATDANKDPVTLTATALPRGATFTDYGDDTALFRWLPDYDQAGSYTVHFTATDGTLSVTLDMHISIAEGTPGAGGVFPDSRSFTAYGQNVRGGFYLASGDVWGDYRDEIVTGTDTGLPPQVRVYSNDATLRSRFYAFPRTFNGGVRVAVCDTNGDARDEIVAAPGAGLAPNIRIFNGSGQRSANGGWAVLNRKSTYGVNVACADITGDRKAEIIVSSGKGGGQVNVYTSSGKRLANFYPFGKPFRGGVSLSAIAATATTPSMIIISSQSGTPLVKAVDVRGKELWRVIPFSARFRGGISTSIGNMLGDGSIELIVAPQSGAQPTVKVYTIDMKRILSTFKAYSTRFLGGVRIATGDVDGDGTQDLLSIPAGGSARASVKLLDLYGKPL